MSAAHPLCFKQLRGPGDGQRVPMLKRRMSAPAESPFVNPFSVTRKRLRLSEPDDLSTRSISSESDMVASLYVDAYTDVIFPR